MRRVRAIYRARRDHLLAALHSAIDPPDIRGVSAGLHLTLALPAHIDELSVVQQALHDHRLALWGLRQHYQGSDAVDGLVLGFSRTATDFEDSVTRLVHTLLRQGGRPPDQIAHLEERSR